MSLLEVDRRRLEDLARPLYQGLDGVDGWPRVERLERIATRLAEDLEVDGALLELLVILHGVGDRLGGSRRDGRLALALRSLEAPPGDPASVARSLRRWRHEPATDEERALHDAVLLESTGFAACLSGLLGAGRRKVPVDRALQGLDPGPGSEAFATAVAADLAATRRRRVSAWLQELEASLEAERQEL